VQSKSTGGNGEELGGETEMWVGEEGGMVMCEGEEGMLMCEGEEEMDMWECEEGRVSWDEGL